MGGNSSGSIPPQAGSAAEMKAAYRLFDATGVTPRLQVQDFRRGIDLLGGRMGRKCDGKLGWLRVRRGRQAFQLILLGVGPAKEDP